jgi:hypothetical protein
MFWVVDGMRDNKERESKGSQIFSICVSSRWSQCNYAAAAAERDLICTTKGYLHRDQENLHIFHIMYKTKTNMNSKTKDKRKHVMKIIIGKMEPWSVLQE